MGGQAFIPMKTKGVKLTMLREQHLRKAEEIFGTVDFDRLSVVHALDPETRQALTPQLALHRIYWITIPEIVQDLVAWKGMKPPDDRPETLRVWSGISVYATAVQARRMARRYRGHGDYIATIRVFEGGPIRIERTLARPGHHTLWARPEELLAAVVGVELL
jgi:hypothetical protein